MAIKYKCIQGDSFSLDFYLKDGTTLGTDWSGTWAIVDILGVGRATLASAIMSQSSDDLKFELRILPNQTDGISVGEYYLVAEVTNTSIGFNKEIIQNNFKITKQGI